MQRLSTKDRIRVVSALVEGNSIASTVRMTGVAKTTVLRLLVSMGEVCARFHEETVVNVYAEKIECDEIWCFVGCKDKQVPAERRNDPTIGSVWTWKAMDADTKLLISHYTGERTGDAAHHFMQDLAYRVRNRTQITTDGHNAYPDAVWHAFGPMVDYAQIVKEYGMPADWLTRYSPPEVIKVTKKRVLGNPDPAFVSTSYIERANLTLRMSQRRFTRLTNAYSKKFENLCHAIALHAVHYNFCRKHQSLGGRTPAQAAGLANYAWTVGELVALLESSEAADIANGSMKRGKYRQRKA